MNGSDSLSTGARFHPRAAGFSLVELLVTIGIIGALAGLLIPAIQSSRQAARRNSCANNLRQLGIAAQHHETSLGYYPGGTQSKAYPSQPSAPWSFFRWSALAQLTPFMENSAIHDSLNLSVPLYDTSFLPHPDNQATVRLMVPEFHCPSDEFRRVSEDFGPTNYVVNTGSGRNGGSPIDTDGIFFVNSETTAAKITDGLSKTAMMSESLVGHPEEDLRDPQFDYKFVFVAPLSENVCRLSNQWNFTDPRGFSWANGEYRCALYNHYWTPNAAVPDCMGVLVGGSVQVKYTPFGWRAARSLHSGGVNVLWADGSLRFVHDTVDPDVWQDASTIAGDEVYRTP
jgi:prepilin-type processing-associated H-X9-DG protein/prepilin-type N-terminal cleavage/methylation domain-containing protein